MRGCLVAKHIQPTVGAAIATPAPFLLHLVPEQVALSGHFLPCLLSLAVSNQNTDTKNLRWWSQLITVTVTEFKRYYSKHQTHPLFLFTWKKRN